MVDTDPVEAPKVKMIELTTARPGPEIFENVIKDEQDENELEQRLHEFAKHLSTAQISDDQWGYPQLLIELEGMHADDKTKAVAKEILERVSS